LSQQAKVNLTYIPYQGGAPALTDVMGAQVSMYFGNAASTLGYVKSGKLRGLAVSSSQRIPGLPDTPTLTNVVPRTRELAQKRKSSCRGHRNYRSETETAPSEAKSNG
jgi:hypothetical protein